MWATQTTQSQSNNPSYAVVRLSDIKRRIHIMPDNSKDARPDVFYTCPFKWDKLPNQELADDFTLEEDGM